jgi:ATP phosphoribosyltransferase regulatory subunit
MKTRQWLPEGMEEWLPPASWKLEALRRDLLDLYRDRGYGLILPPLLEHLETLMAGAGAALEEQTFKLVDPASGRLLGLRADMTPQAAHIAARRYPDQKVVRLCYLGTVLRARADSIGGARSPRQVGCEIFGDGDVSADLEILDLLLETLARAGVRDAHLDLGHVGIYRAIAAGLNLSPADEDSLFEILQRKSVPELDQFAGSRKFAARAAKTLRTLIDLNGDVTVLKRARAELKSAGAAVVRCLDVLERAAGELGRKRPHLPIHVDLAELRGYRYQTGMVFAAFAPGHGRELARGGRYEAESGASGRTRPATGFSADLNELLRLGSEK